jgi:hypothetical protein
LVSGGEREIVIQTENFLDEVLSEIAHADALDLAALDQFLESAPCVLELYLLVEQICSGLRILREQAFSGDELHRPMDKVEIKVVRAQIFQGLVKSGLYILRAVAMIPELRGDKDLVTGHTGGLYPGAHLLLVGIDGGGVDMSIPCL